MKSGFIGLGAMGMGMARNLLAAGHEVNGYDISQKARDTLVREGGSQAQNAREAASGAEALIIMVINAEQVRDVLFAQGAAKALPEGAVVLLCPTILPNDANLIGKQLLNMNLLVLDCPVSGGKTGADLGTLSVLASGSELAFEKAKPILDAISKKVYRVGDQPGQGSNYKIVHQLAAGVHLCVMAEVLALGARAGCDPETLSEIVNNSAGQSWMFGDRAPYVLKEDYEPRSAVDIFLKDMSLVLKAAENLRMPLPIAAAAQQLFVAASSSGYGRLNDAAIVKIYEDMTGVKVAQGISGLD